MQGILLLLVGALFWFLAFGVFNSEPEIAASIICSLTGGICIGLGLVKVVNGE